MLKKEGGTRGKYALSKKRGGGVSLKESSCCPFESSPQAHTSLISSASDGDRGEGEGMNGILKVYEFYHDAL